MQSDLERGFTLVELMVSISIFAVITSAAVYNNSQFNGSVILTNLAYEVALSVRQAQFYGISVKQNASQNFDSGYGVHFDTSNPTSYILFEDKTGGIPHVRDGGDTDLQVFSIAKGNKITKLCFDGTCGGAAVSDITFLRPNPDAFITVVGVTGTYKSKAEICLVSPRGTARKVVVESTGQISVAADADGSCTQTSGGGGGGGFGGGGQQQQQ